MTKSLKELIKDHGGPTEFAKALDVTPQAVSQWKQVPTAHVLTVEKITGVSRHELRPDVFGPAPSSEAA